MSISPKIHLHGLSVSYYTKEGLVPALDDVHLNLAEGEFVTLIGPSGCGKSTLLNVLAGLVHNNSAFIEGQVCLPTVSNGQRSSLGYVFQKDVLLPWRTVKANVELGLEIQGISAPERSAIALKWIMRVGLRGFENRYPHQLSVGMRQRVGLIRTLIYRPAMVLMDEPFGALDSQTRILLQEELLKLWQDEQQTILFVTHDLAEAITLGDRVLVMSRRPGHIQAEYAVDLPRPRTALAIRRNPRFEELQHAIWKDFEKIVAEHEDQR